MTYDNDANSIEEPQRRRKQFASWLLCAWEYATENSLNSASVVADLISHVDEPDYPLWEMAEHTGITGNSILAKLLYQHCGPYPDGPRANDWDRFINYSPIIRLDEPTWRHIHGQLGWPNRNHDRAMKTRNFWLWSNQGNVVRFVMREEMDYGL
jgi:hypothetical protein